MGTKRKTFHDFISLPVIMRLNNSGHGITSAGLSTAIPYRWEMRKREGRKVIRGREREKEGEGEGNKNGKYGETDIPRSRGKYVRAQERGQVLMRKRRMEMEQEWLKEQEAVLMRVLFDEPHAHTHTRTLHHSEVETHTPITVPY